MEYLRESSENEMIALFLQTEIRSERYRDEIMRVISDLGAHGSIILEPDLDSCEENALRKRCWRFRLWEDREIRGFLRMSAGLGEHDGKRTGESQIYRL